VGPTQGDEKRLLFSNDSPWGRPSSLCHLDRSGEICGLPIPGPQLRATTTRPFVISTEVERSAVCQFLDLSCGPQRPFPLSSRPKWRDLRFAHS
jgi:hypothetical protein